MLIVLVVLCGCVWPLLARYAPPWVTGRLPFLKTAAARRRQREKKKQQQREAEQAAAAAEADITCGSGPETTPEAIGITVDATPPSRTATAATEGLEPASSRREHRSKSVAGRIANVVRRASESLAPSSAAPASPTRTRSGSSRNGRSASGAGWQSSPKGPSPQAASPQSPFPLPYPPGYPPYPTHSPYPPPPPPGPYPYTAAYPPYPPYGPAYTPAHFPQPPPTGSQGAQWQWQSPRGWVLESASPPKPVSPEAAATAAGTTMTASDASALSPPMKFVDSISSNGKKACSGSKVRCKTTTTTTDQEYVHDIDTTFIKELLEEAAGELRQEKRELTAATVAALKGRMAEARGAGRREGWREAQRETRALNSSHPHRRGVGGGGRRAQGPSSGGAGGGGAGGGGAARRHRSTSSPAGGNISRSRPSDADGRGIRQSRRAAGQSNPPSNTATQAAQAIMSEEMGGSSDAADGAAVHAQHRPAGGCWCGSTNTLPHGWRGASDQPLPARPTSPGTSNLSRRSPTTRAWDGSYQSPRPQATQGGGEGASNQGAGTPPAPQTLDWDAVYAAINTGGIAGEEARKLTC